MGKVFVSPNSSSVFTVPEGPVEAAQEGPQVWGEELWQSQSLQNTGMKSLIVTLNYSLMRAHRNGFRLTGAWGRQCCIISRLPLESRLYPGVGMQGEGMGTPGAVGTPPLLPAPLGTDSPCLTAPCPFQGQHIPATAPPFQPQANLLSTGASKPSQSRVRSHIRGCPCPSGVSGHTKK